MAIVLLLLLFSHAFCEPVHLDGVGNNFPWPIFSDWTYAYTLTYKEVTLNYTVTKGTLGVKDLIDQNPDADFYTTIGFVSTNSSEWSQNLKDIQLIPFCLGSLVPTYNIPSLAYADGRTETPQLVLSTAALVDIFRGRIIYWNDTRISQDNPGTSVSQKSQLFIKDVILPEAPITTVLRSDSSSFTYTMMASFSKFVSDWDYIPHTYWPQEIIDLPYTYMTYDNFGMIADVNAINNSIGYISLSQMLTQRIAIAKSYALMKNEAGVVVSPYDVLEAQQNKTFDQYLFANFLNSQQGWPIILADFVYIPNNVTQNCTKLRELFKFLYWTKTATEAISRNGEEGFAPWSNQLNDQIVNYLTTAKCNGNLILKVEYDIPQHRGKSFDFFLVLSLVLLGISFVLGGVWHYLNQSKCSKVVVMYQIILLIGVTMTYLSVIFWYMIPTTSTICELRMWLTTLGYSFILTAMFERTWQIRRVYGKVVKGNQLTVTVTSFVEVGGGIGIVIALQIIIMVVWISVDPYQSVSVPGISPFDASYACASKYSNVWLSIQVVYFGILLMWAVYAIYSTWSIRTFIVESRWILISMYNVLLFLALLATLLATLHENDDLLFNLVAPFIEMSTTSVVVAVYCPSVLKELKIIASTDSLSNSHGSRTKSGKSDKTTEETHPVTSKRMSTPADIEMN